MLKDKPETSAQAIAKAVADRLERECSQFEAIVKAQATMTAGLLAKDINLELDQVVMYGEEPVILEAFILAPSDTTGINLKVRSYRDDRKVATLSPSEIKP